MGQDNWLVKAFQDVLLELVYVGIHLGVEVGLAADRIAANRCQLEPINTIQKHLVNSCLPVAASFAQPLKSVAWFGWEEPLAGLIVVDDSFQGVGVLVFGLEMSWDVD